jgi:hypothetical protein
MPQAVSKYRELWLQLDVRRSHTLERCVMVQHGTTGDGEGNASKEQRWEHDAEQ